MTIVVAGGTGLAGSAIVRAYVAAGHEVIPVNRKVVDLLDRDATFNFIASVKPTLVIDAAAKVGGIGANNAFPVEFLADNLRIQSNLMEAAHAADVEKFIFLGSSCIYPRDCAQPIKEEYLLTGPLEETNSAYAVAKIAGIELIKSFRKEYGRKWISLMPTNLYGPFDNFELQGSHVLPAFIRRFVEATESDAARETLWGTGSPKREAMIVEFESLLPITDFKSAKKKFYDLMGKWQKIGMTDRKKRSAFDARIKKVEDEISDLERNHQRKSDPSAKAQANKVVQGLAEAIENYEKQAAKAEAAGQTAKAMVAREAAAARRAWLEQAEKGLTEFTS